ncbi:hypothetical protein VUR80DRAFT_4544 [Thermomyces stellatus]
MTCARSQILAGVPVPVPGRQEDELRSPIWPAGRLPNIAEEHKGGIVSGLRCGVGTAREGTLRVPLGGHASKAGNQAAGRSWPSPADPASRHPCASHAAQLRAPVDMDNMRTRSATCALEAIDKRRSSGAMFSSGPGSCDPTGARKDRNCAGSADALDINYGQAQDGMAWPSRSPGNGPLFHLATREL